MRRVGPFLLAAVIAIVPGRVAAESAAPVPPSSGGLLDGWDNVVLEGPRPPGTFELRLNLGGERSDNLLQSPPARGPEPIAAARTEARLTCRLLPVVPLKMSVELGQVRYDGRAATTAFGAGLGLEGERHVLLFLARVERDRPSVDIGDGFDVDNNALSLRLRYARRTAALEGWASAERLEQKYPDRTIRNGAHHTLQAGIVYLGLSKHLAPEVSFGWSRNNGVGDNEVDFRQLRAQVGVRYTPARFVALTARFEHTWRTHEVVNTAARNFGRRDTRGDWNVQAQFRLTRYAAWTMVYDHLSSDSTRVTREFATDYLSGALTLRLGSTETRKPLARPPATLPPSHALVPHESTPVVVARSVPAPSVPVAPAPPAPAGAFDEPYRALPAMAPVVVPVRGGGSALQVIEIVRRGDETIAIIRGDGVARFTTLSLDGPPRFVVDIEGVTIASSTTAVDDVLVRAVRAAPFRGAGPSPTARLVFDLNAPAAAEVEPDPAGLRVRLWIGLR